MRLLRSHATTTGIHHQHLKPVSTSAQLTSMFFRLINSRLQLTYKTLQVIKFRWLLLSTVAMPIGCNGRRALATLRCFVTILPVVMVAATKRCCTSQLHWCETRMQALLNSYRHSYRSFRSTLVSVGCSSKCRTHLLCSLHCRLQIHRPLCTHQGLH